MATPIVFSASEIATSLASSYTVCAKQRATAARRGLLAARFDQAPVLNEERLVGWVRTAHLSGRGPVSSHLIPLDRCVVLSSDAALSNVIGLVARAGFVFLAGAAGIDRFVVPSDLDRHAVRSYLYVVLSEIEFHLADLVREWVPEPQIIENFESDQRESYESSHSKGRETHAVEYLYLSSYISLIKRTPALAAVLGWTDSTHRRELAEVNELRTCVAHPSRSLFGRFDPVEIERRAALAERLLHQLRQTVRVRSG